MFMWDLRLAKSKLISNFILSQAKVPTFPAWAYFFSANVILFCVPVILNLSLRITTWQWKTTMVYITSGEGDDKLITCLQLYQANPLDHVHQSEENMLRPLLHQPVMFLQCPSPPLLQFTKQVVHVLCCPLKMSVYLNQMCVWI